MGKTGTTNGRRFRSANSGRFCASLPLIYQPRKPLICVCISAVNLGQQDIAAGPLDQRTDRAAVVRPLDQIPLPMPWHGTSLNLQWSLMDRAHAHDLASAIFALASFTAGLVMLAQMGNQFLAQTASWLRINIGIDRLVSDLMGGIFGKHSPQSTGDLLGRQVQIQQVPYIAPQGGRGIQFAFAARGRTAKLDTPAGQSAPDKSQTLSQHRAATRG